MTKITYVSDELFERLNIPEVYIPDSIVSALENRATGDTCVWTEEESDDYNERHFESSCGLGFHIDDGRSLAENKILFCAKCGKKISEANK